MSSRSKIIVLEDDPRRISSMRAEFLASKLNQELRFFDNAYSLCDWLEDAIENAALISLDHDLDTTAIRDSVDPGNGDDVVDWLTCNHCKLPVIIHSSNAMIAPGMHMKLVMAGWTDIKLAPFSNASYWMDAVRRLLQHHDAA